MSTACFLVERRNERTAVVPGQPFCCDPPMEGCTPVPDREECLFDAVRVDTGEVLLRDIWHLSGLPVGAMWWSEWTERKRPAGPDDWAGYEQDQLERNRTLFAEHPEWYSRGASPTDPTLPARSPSYTFTDGPQLHVMTPGGLWVIDSRASNCGLPYDYEHRCWVRHGEPPVVTVDKNGRTCHAGGGSIMCGSYHGFLQGGVLT